MIITSYTELTSGVDSQADFLVITDVSDTSMAATGTTKKVKTKNLFQGMTFDANENVILKKAQCDQSYSRQTPSTGFNITIANNITRLVLHPSGTLATGTIVMPSTPVDGQLVSVLTSQTITSLTVSPNSGQSILNAPTTLSAGGSFTYIYIAADTTWYRW